MDARRKFGPYEVIEEIGRGGMATVYRARDPRIGRMVALKVLPREMLHDPQFLERFRREMRTVASLEHPAIVPIYDVGEQDGQPYFVMRLMDGGSLEDLLRKKGRLSLRETLQILNRLASALDEVHSRGVVHRDLKPGNILFDHAGQAYLSDFGIAKVGDATMTITGQSVVGTPTYISPEQAQGKPVDHRSDIYALGVILYQMLTGDVPYKAETPVSLLFKHINDPVPSACASVPDLPAGVDYVIQRAMAKVPDDRFASCEEMVAALQAASQGSGETQQMPPARTVVSPPLQPTVVNEQIASGKKVPGWLWPVLALLLVALAGGGWAFWARGTAAPTASPVPTVLSAATPTSFPTALLVVSPSPAATEPPLTETPQPSPTPLPTETPVPALPTLGGADRLAFIARNDIWVVNVDGSNLEQLTLDGAEKTGLQWLPDGRLLYRVGLCLKAVDVESGREDLLACLPAVQFIEGAQVSPDGTRLALSLDRQLYILPFEPDVLAGLRTRPDVARAALCRVASEIATKDIRWGDDTHLAVVFAGVDGPRRVDLIRLLEIRSCAGGAEADVRRLDEFPAQRFGMSGYNDNPVIPAFSWDRTSGVLLHSSRRNGGFGNLYVYHPETHKAQALDPLGTTCCYRDPAWSPDGLYLAVAYQDLTQGAESQTQLYLLPFGLLDSGASFAPIPLPEDFFDRLDSPQPVFHPAE